jgi:hypothetical protein
MLLFPEPEGTEKQHAVSGQRRWQWRARLHLPSPDAQRSTGFRGQLYDETRHRPFVSFISPRNVLGSQGAAVRLDDLTANRQA